MSKEGQQLVREHVNALPDAGSNMTRQQSLSTPSMPVQTETDEHVMGKKARKKHLQRSIDKLVAAKEQLPEEEGRDVRGVSWSEVATVPKRKSHRGLDLDLSLNTEVNIWKGWKENGGTK